jgi:hypothetical protein
MGRLKIICLSACFLALTTVRQAPAATYYFDAGTGGTSIPVQVPTTSGICFGCGGYLTPLFEIPSGQFQPGDILDFGTVALYPSSVGQDQYGDIFFYSDYFAETTTGQMFGPPGAYPNGGFGCNALAPGSTCPSLVQAAWNAAEASPTIRQLDFTVGTGALDIQMDWAFANYTPPAELTTTPLPAGLPLFAAGLGVIALLGWRRKRVDQRHC